MKTNICEIKGKKDNYRLTFDLSAKEAELILSLIDTGRMRFAASEMGLGDWRKIYTKLHNERKTSKLCPAFREAWENCFKQF